MLKGKVWSRIINREDYDDFNEKYNLLSSKFNEDNTLNIRVYAEQQPHETFEEVKPMLEDVYFVSLKNDQ